MTNILISVDEGWRNGSWEKIEKENKVKIIRNIEVESSIKKKLFNILYSYKLNIKIKLPFKRIFYKDFIKCLGLDKTNSFNIFVYDRMRLTLGLKFFKYLKKYNKNIKTIYLFSNIVAMSGAKEFKIENKLNKYFDYVFAFDRNDASKYNFKYSNLIFEPIIPDCNENEVDMFLVAKSKNRINEIIKIYDELKKYDYKIKFYVNGLSNEDKLVIGNRVIIKDYFLPYEDVMKNIVNTRCVVDIMQKGSTGVTLNICEAIICGKKIITNNDKIIEEKFYHPSRIYIVGESRTIQEFMNEEMLPYSEEDKHIFTFKHLLEQIV